MTSFPVNSSFRFHLTGLKLVGQLHHEEVQHILFWVTVHQSLIQLSLFLKDFSDVTWFLDHSSYIFLLDEVKETW